MTPTDEEINQTIKWYGKRVADIILALKARAEAAEKETSKWDGMWVKAVRTIAERDKEIDRLRARVEAAEAALKRIANHTTSDVSTMVIARDALESKP